MKGPYQSGHNAGVSTTDVVTAHTPPDPCPECCGDGQLLVEFSHGYQVQDCFTCDGAGFTP